MAKGLPDPMSIPPKLLDTPCCHDAPIINQEMYTIAFQMEPDQTKPLKNMPKTATETTNRSCAWAEVAAFVLSKGLPSPPGELEVEAEAEVVAKVGVDAECDFEDVDRDEVVIALTVDECLGFAVVVWVTAVDPEKALVAVDGTLADEAGCMPKPIRSLSKSNTV